MSMLSYPRIFIAAGERSGDRFGASLAEAILEIEPDARITGVGGPRMAGAGVRILADTVQHSGMGFFHSFVNIGKWIKVFRRCIREFNGDPPDILVPIDNPGFNLRLAGHARERGIPVCYYVSPQVWAWLPHRIHRVGRLVDRMMTILPFEKSLYDKIGVDCRYVGHPLMDYLAPTIISPAARAEFLAAQGLNTPPIGLLPGSRIQEVLHTFPIIAGAAAILKKSRPDLQFLVAAATDEHLPAIREILRSRNLTAKVLVGRTNEIMQSSRLCLVVSGTATLETAYYRTPMVVVYRTSALNARLAPKMLKVRHISLVNILAGREIVPEFLTSNDNAAPVADAALRLLAEPAHQECRINLDAVMSTLGPAGTTHRAAQAVLDCLNHPAK